MSHSQPRRSCWKQMSPQVIYQSFTFNFAIINLHASCTSSLIFSSKSVTLMPKHYPFSKVRKSNCKGILNFSSAEFSGGFVLNLRSLNQFSISCLFLGNTLVLRFKQFLIDSTQNARVLLTFLMLQWYTSQLKKGEQSGKSYRNSERLLFYERIFRSLKADKMSLVSSL